MSHLKLSIVIPHYNSPHYLERALLSIKQQTYSDIEVIVVDDCSSSHNKYQLDALKSLCPNLKIFYNKINLGVSSTRNFGASVATGDLITFLDADDLYVTIDKVERDIEIYIDKVNLSSKPILVFPRVGLANETCTSFQLIHEYFFLLPTKYLVFGTMLPRDFLMSRHSFLETAKFNPNVSFFEDWIFRMQIASLFDFVYSPNSITCYRQNDSTISLSKRYSSFRKISSLLSTFHTYSKSLCFFDRIISLFVLFFYHFHVSFVRSKL